MKPAKFDYHDPTTVDEALGLMAQSGDQARPLSRHHPVHPRDAVVTMAERVSPVSTPVAPAPSERGWGKLLFALLAFLLIPTIPQFRALLPIEQTTDLLIPVIAACALVGSPRPRRRTIRS